MATAKELLDLYKSISDTDKDKQAEFSVILSKLFYMIEQNHAIDMSSKYTFDRNFAKYDNVMNERQNATGTVVRRLLKEQIARVISAFSNYDSKTRLQKIETKINAVIDYAENYRKSLPTIGDFQRVLSGSSASGAAAPPVARLPPPPPPPSRAAAAAKAPLKPLPPRQQPMQSVVGTEPFRGLTRDLQARCRTLEGLNEYIAGLYPGDRDSAPAGHQDVQAIVSTCRNLALRDFLRGWRPKNSYGYRNDCLIESFLTTTCPAFRFLVQDHKNTVAENFRQLFFASQPEISEHRNSHRLLDEIRDHRFLGNEHLSILSEIYRVDFLMLENRALGRAGATHFEINRSARVYIIINPDNAHYEAVQPRDRNEDYSISRDEAMRVVECINAEAIGEAEESRGISQRACLPTGSVVLYRGGRYVILDGKVIVNRNTGEATCEGYYLSTHDMLAAFSALPNSFNEGGRRLYKESTAIKQRYLSFPNLIPAGEVQAAATTVGRRAANAAGLVAAGFPVRMTAAAVSEQQIAANVEAARRIAAEEEKKMENREAQEAANANFARRVAAGEFDGGSRRQQSRRKRTVKARRRSLRAGRRTPSKGKGHGSRRKR